MPLPSDVLARHLKEFTARAGHDLCGPLNQASSLAALFVQRYRGQIDSDADAILGHLSTSAHRMNELVDGLRKYGEAASPLPPLAPADLNQILLTALRPLRVSIEKTGAVINTLSPLPMLEVAADRIRMLFEAVISNAIQYSKPETAPRIAIEAYREGDCWCFSVCDEGVGIDPEHIESVFLPFRRLHGRAWPGSGLGLSTAQLVVESHDGKMHIESSKDVGTKVAFTLPFRSDPQGSYDPQP